MSGARMLMRAACLLAGIGLLLVMFVGYQLWGTAYVEHHSQDMLQRRLQPVLRGARPVLTPGARRSTRLASSGRHGLPPVASGPALGTPPPAIGTPIGYLVIPRIALDDVIVEGVGEAQLQQGPGHYPGTPEPGQAGNAAIAGHRTTYAAPFYNLNELQPGDPIYVLSAQGLFRYNVVRSFAVLPTQVSVLAPSTVPELTLTTCNPRYSAAQRLVVVATMQLRRPRVRGGSQPSRSAQDRPIVAVGSSLADGRLLQGTSSAGDFAPAIGWGIAVIALSAMLWQYWRRSRARLRWLLVPLAAAGDLVLLLTCFAHVSAALPPGF